MPRENLILTRAKDGRVLQEQREVMAVEVHPPPADLPADQAEVWREALSTVPAKFFRERHLLLLRQYTKVAVALHSEDMVDEPRSYFRLLRTLIGLHSTLGLGVKTEIVRVRSEEDAKARREQREEFLRARLEALKGGGGTDPDKASPGGSAPRGPSRANFSFTGGHPRQ